MITFQDALKFVADAARALALPPTVEINGRAFRDPAFVEVPAHEVDRTEYVAATTVADLASLVRWAYATSECDGEVVVSLAGETVARTPRRVDTWHDRDACTLKFHRAALPPASGMGYLAFASWIDRVGEGLVDVVKIRDALATVSTYDGSAKKVQQRGAVVQFVGETKQDVSAPLPRYLRATIPFGDPGFETEVAWVLTASVGRSGDPQFALERADLGRANERWAEYAVERLDAELPDGWLVVVGP